LENKKVVKNCLKDDNVGADLQLQGIELKTNRALTLKALREQTSLYVVFIMFTNSQWLILAPFRVSNAFYLTLICQLLHIVLIIIIISKGPA